MGQDTELTALTLSQARDGLRAKEFSARELTQSFVDRVAASEKLNAYILQTPERALEAADQSDARLGIRRCPTVGRPAYWREGFVLHKRGTHHGVFEYFGRFYPDL